MKRVANTQDRKPVTIEFTPHECAVLAAICAKIAGSPELSNRKVTDDLGLILKSEGYSWEEQYHKIAKIGNGIYWENNQ